MWRKKLRLILREWFFLENGRCPVCGRLLFISDNFLCDRCFEALPLNNGPICTRCGKGVPREEMLLCGDCAKRDSQFICGGFAWLRYEKGSKRMVKALKFGHRPQLGHFIGAQMAKELRSLPWIEEIEVLLPVPLHPNRLEERGYNQSMMIAEGIAQAKGFEGVSLLKNVLIRVKDTRHQIGLTREQRLTNLDDAFALTDNRGIRGRTLLLIDDVNTTGTTLEKCAKVLMAEGASAVFVATCASAG